MSYRESHVGGRSFRFENQYIFFRQASEVEEELLLQKIYQQSQEEKFLCTYLSDLELLFSYKVMILVSRISCGTITFLKHLTKISCIQITKHDIQ